MESYSSPVYILDSSDPLTTHPEHQETITHTKLIPEETISIVKETLPYDYPRFESTQNSVLISVANPQLRDKKLGKYVIYTVKGSDLIGSFEAYRRYKDFEWLRKLLASQWPGCYIPAVPGKQAIGNLSHTFIEMRRKLLEEFVVKSASIDYIFNSDVFKIFIRGPENFKGNTASYVEVSVQNILGRYIQHFPQFAEVEVTSNTELDIENARKFVKEMSEFLDNFSLRIKFVGAYYGSFIEGFSTLCKEVQDYDSKFLADFREQKRQGVNVELKNTFVNPFDVLLDWVRVEQLDHTAMLETLNVVFDLKNRLNVASSKLASERLNLMKAQAGRKSISQFFSKKSQKDQVNYLEGGIKIIETQIHDYSVLLQIVTARLAMCEIPRFKTAKASKYDLVVKTYASVSSEEFEYLATVAKNIQSQLV